MKAPRRDDAAPRRSRPWMAPARLAVWTTAAFVTAAALAPRAAAVTQEPVEQIVIGGVTPRFAVPECVPRRPDEASQAACRTLTQVLRSDLRFEGLFQFVPDSLLSAIPPLNPDAPQFEDWKGIGAKILVATSARASSPSRCASSSWTPGRRCWPAVTRASPTTPASSRTRPPTTS